MIDITIEALEEKCISMYKLVIATARRASQISRPENRPLIATSHRKPTIIALEEVVSGKIIIRTPSTDDDVVE